MIQLGLIEMAVKITAKLAVKNCFWRAPFPVTELISQRQCCYPLLGKPLVPSPPLNLWPGSRLRWGSGRPFFQVAAPRPLSCSHPSPSSCPWPLQELLFSWQCPLYPGEQREHPFRQYEKKSGQACTLWKKDIFWCYQRSHQVMCPLIKYLVFFFYLCLVMCFIPWTLSYLKKLFLSNSPKNHQCHSHKTFQRSGISLKCSQCLFRHEPSNSWMWFLLGSLHSFLATPAYGCNLITLHACCTDVLPMIVNGALGRMEITDPQDAPSPSRLTHGPRALAA